MPDTAILIWTHLIELKESNIRFVAASSWNLRTSSVKCSSNLMPLKKKEFFSIRYKNWSGRGDRTAKSKNFLTAMSFGMGQGEQLRADGASPGGQGGWIPCRRGQQGCWGSARDSPPLSLAMPLSFLLQAGLQCWDMALGPAQTEARINNVRIKKPLKIVSKWLSQCIFNFLKNYILV